MSVRSHLKVSPAAYDREIRTLIPRYDELVREAAAALRYSMRPVRRIVDLGMGTGALTNACLSGRPRARVWGIDADPAMLRVAAVRLRRRASSVTMVAGSFLEVPIPTCDAIVASYALHHIRTRRQKQVFYRTCHQAIRPGGVLVTGDCAPASTPRGFASDLDVWFDHLAKSFKGRAAGRRVYASWADEDTYTPLADEVRMLARAGFTVDVPWRQSPFAVIVGVKPGARS